MPSSSLSDNWVAVPDRGFCMTEDNVEVRDKRESCVCARGISL